MATLTDTTELITKKIKDLPPLPLVIQKLIEIMGDENASATDISQVLSTDQAVASKVLKIVNSSFFGLSGKVSTISRAIVILGISPLRNLAVGMGVAKLMKSSSVDLQQCFWDHAIACAATADVVARHVDYADPEEAFIAGLLHDMGHLVLWQALPEEFIAVVEQGPENILENEKKMLGMAHTRAGQKLLRHWKLPEDLGAAVRFHHTPKVFMGKDDPLISLVALADALSRVFGEVYERTMSDADFLKLTKVVGFDVSQATDVFQEIQHRIAESREFLQIVSDGDFCESTDIQHVSRRITLICTDKKKVAWAKPILEYYGHELVPMQQFFAGAGQTSTIDLVMVDPQSLSAQQLAKVKPVLAKYIDKIVLYGRDEKHTLTRALGRDLDVLSLVFSRSDIESRC